MAHWFTLYTFTYMSVLYVHLFPFWKTDEKHTDTDTLIHTHLIAVEDYDSNNTPISCQMPGPDVIEKTLRPYIIIQRKKSRTRLLCHVQTCVNKTGNYEPFSTLSLISWNDCGSMTGRKFRKATNLQDKKWISFQFSPPFRFLWSYLQWASFAAKTRNATDICRLCPGIWMHQAHSQRGWDPTKSFLHDLIPNHGYPHATQDFFATWPPLAGATEASPPELQSWTSGLQLQRCPVVNAGTLPHRQYEEQAAGDQSPDRVYHAACPRQHPRSAWGSLPLVFSLANEMAKNFYTLQRKERPPPSIKKVYRIVSPWF